MRKKKSVTKRSVTTRLPEKAWELFNQIFAEGSAYGDLSLFQQEALNLFKLTLPELKIFKKEEIDILADVTNSWLIDCRQFSPKMMLLHEIEDYFRLEKNCEPDPELLCRIETISDWQVFVLLRWIKGLWANGEIEKANFFFQGA